MPEKDKKKAEDGVSVEGDAKGVTVRIPKKTIAAAIAVVIGAGSGGVGLWQSLQTSSDVDTRLESIERELRHQDAFNRWELEMLIENGLQVDPRTIPNREMVIGPHALTVGAKSSAPPRAPVSPRVRVPIQDPRIEQAAMPESEVNP